MFKQLSQKTQQDKLASNETYQVQLNRDIVRLLRGGYGKNDMVHLVVVNRDGSRTKISA